MIKQGTNKPIIIVLDAEPVDIAVTLHNEITTLKHWNIADLIASEDGKTFTAGYTQQESSAWEEGPCEIEVRWTDSDGIVHKREISENIEWTKDNTVLATESET